MNLRVVEAFYWVVTLKSVTRAAEKLHLTQSAMSSRIASLEQELGILLLDRRDKQFRVTAAGQPGQPTALYRAVGEARARLQPDVAAAHAEAAPIEGPIREMWETLRDRPVPGVEMPRRFR